MRSASPRWCTRGRWCLTGSAGRMPRLALAVVFTALGMLGFGSPVGALNFEDYVTKLRDTHPAFTAFEARLNVARRRVEEAQPEYRRFRHSLEPGYSFAGENQAAEWNADARHDAELGASITREFSTGGRVTLSAQTRASLFRNQRSLEMPADVEDREQYALTLGAGFSQPLLRNIGDTRGRLPAEKAAYEPEIAKLAARQQEQELVREAAELFVRWAQAAARVDTWVRQLEVAEDRIDYVADLVEADLRDEVDLLRAESEHSRTVADLERAKTRRESLRARVAASMGRSPSELPVRPEVDLLDTAALLGEESAETAEKETLGALGEHGLREQELGARIEQLEAERSIREELIGPEAFLDIDVEMLASDEDPLDAMDSPTPAVRIGGRLELDTGTAEARRLARIDAEIEELESRILRSRHERSAKHAEHIALLEQSARLMERYREVEDRAEQLANREQDRYQRGLATVSEVLESEQAVYEARRALYDAAGQYHRAAVAAAAWSDSLVEAFPR